MTNIIKLKSGKEIVLKGRMQDEFIYEGDVTEEDINEIVEALTERARQERRILGLIWAPCGHGVIELQQNTSYWKVK